MAYLKWKEGVDPKRPVTFVFNGGPGSASLWLHLGGVGPRRVVMTDEGDAPKPPAEIADNPDSWLGVTDLVFIDPVGTGYSRPAKGRKQSEFSGLEEDTNAVAEFIRAWVTKHNRWSSPKFLAGESYGTTRAASVAAALQERHGMRLNGIVLVSMVLDFQTIRGSTDNYLPDVLFLPAFTATAWYHKKVGGERAPLLAAAERVRHRTLSRRTGQGDRPGAGGAGGSCRRLREADRSRSPLRGGVQPSREHEPIRQGAAPGSPPYGGSTGQPADRHRPGRGRFAHRVRPEHGRRCGAVQWRVPAVHPGGAGVPHRAPLSHAGRRGDAGSTRRDAIRA